MTSVATNPTVQAALFPPKRPRARKIKKPLGPFETSCTSFDKGKERPIEIVMLLPHGIIYRLKGTSQEYLINHDTVFIRAVGLAAGINTGRRETSRIKRGEANQ